MTFTKTHDADQMPITHAALVARMTRAALCCVALAGCDLSERATIDEVHISGGDATRGHAILASGAHGCTGCHAIPGVQGARGVVGPPLAGMARRAFVAGQLPSEPDVLLAFLQDPPALVPQTGMPNVLLSLQEARDIAAYLYTLESPNGR